MVFLSPFFNFLPDVFYYKTIAKIFIYAKIYTGNSQKFVQYLMYNCKGGYICVTQDKTKF